MSPNTQLEAFGRPRKSTARATHVVKPFRPTISKPLANPKNVRGSAPRTPSHHDENDDDDEDEASDIPSKIFIPQNFRSQPPGEVQLLVEVVNFRGTATSEEYHPPRNLLDDLLKYCAVGPPVYLKTEYRASHKPATPTICRCR